MTWDFDSLEGVEAIIGHIGGVRPFATRMQVAVGTVQGWKKRGKIPANRRAAVEALLAEDAEKESPQEASEDAAASGEEKEKESSALDLMGDDFSENDSAIEEGLVSAFTNQPEEPSPAQARPDPESRGSEVDITEEVWEHAALPRSTAGQWAILLSIISIVAVLTRPLWADRIDRKLMTMMHGEEAHQVEEGEATHEEQADLEGAEKAATTRSDLNPLSPPPPDAMLPELTERLSHLENKVGELLSTEKEETAPFKSSIREIKSEVDSLGAAFDNQNARLDAIRRTLVLQREEALGIANRIDAVETQRDTARLSRRLQALFLLDRLSYAIEHAQPFSVKDLRGVLSAKERADFFEFLQVLEKTKKVVSESTLLRAYRHVLPALLAAREHEGIWARLRAQIFSVFSVRRIEGDDGNPLLRVERMLEESQLSEAQKTLNKELETQKTNFSAKSLGDSTRARLLAFIRDLRTRNEAFEAVSSMQRRVISLEGGAQSSTSQP